MVLTGNGMINQGYSSSYILTTDGKIYGTGYNGAGQLGLGDTTNKNTFVEIQHGSNGAKVVDLRAFGYGGTNLAGFIITQDDGTMMSAGNNSVGTNPVDVNSTGQISVLKYVIGFGPGQNMNQFSGSLVPFNLVTGANLGNVLDNLNFTQQWDWSTASTTNALVMTANQLTSGALQTLSTSNTTFTGSLLNIISSGNSASSTGSLVKLDVQGTNSSSTALKITNAGTGLSVDVSGGLALRAGSDFSAVGVTNNAPLGNASLIRMTGISPQNTSSYFLPH
jgi:hypothetical protein